ASRKGNGQALRLPACAEVLASASGRAPGLAAGAGAGSGALRRRALSGRAASWSRRRSGRRIAPSATTTTTIPAAQLDRLRTGIRIRFETRYHFARQGALDQPFDILEHDVLIHANQGYRFAAGAGTAGA